MKIKDIIIEVETYQPPELAVGDKILKGKFKNSPAEIKGFKKDKHNQPVLKTNKGEVQLFKPRVTKLMTELNYPGNIGIMEVSKFYETAPPQQIKLFKQLIAAGKNKEAWRLFQLVTNTDIENVFDNKEVKLKFAMIEIDESTIIPYYKEKLRLNEDRISSLYMPSRFKTSIRYMLRENSNDIQKFINQLDSIDYKKTINHTQRVQEGHFHKSDVQAD